MRASIVSMMLGFAPAMIGCGNDAKPAPMVDSGPTGSTFKGYGADEGGEIRIEYVRFMDGSAGTRILAYLYANPGSTKYFPFPNLDGTCTDMTTKKNWPAATNPLSERVYLDPGDIIISSPMSSTALTTPKPALTLPRVAMQGNDFLDRTHAANKWFFYFNPSDGLNFLSPNVPFDVILTGSADMPGQVFHNVAYMPADFQLMAPKLSDPVVLKANTAQTFTWSTPTSNTPSGTPVFSLVAFVGPNPGMDDGLAVLCAGPNTGSITVPGTFVDIVRTKYPTGGLIARQTFTHTPLELKDNNGPTGRRLDLISVWCAAVPYSVQ